VGGGGVNELGQAVGRFGWNFFGARPAVLDERLSSDDPFLALSKGPSFEDMHHRFTAGYVLNLPFGQGRAINFSGPLDWILGGWELTGITTLEAGIPVVVGYGIDNSGGSSVTYVNQNGDPNKGPKTILQWFDTSVFSAPIPQLDVISKKLDPLLAIGNAGRAPVVGPGIQNWDLGIYKNFPFHEDYNIQFRWELFNAFNHANFGQPVSTFVSSQFGRISSAAQARQMQFALKLSF
jgi:hypothetical protein